MVEPQVLNEAGVSEREAEVLALVGEHMTNAEIGARLFISVRTVESHVSSLLRKLTVSDRRALAELASSLRTDDGEPVAAGVGPSLPSPLTSFVGRVAERAALAEALEQHRLVTAVGPGGVGKTRLALAVAADVTSRYARGAWYVDLVPVTDAGMVDAAVATSLGFGELLGRSPTETVIARLGDAHALVVLDNCEHVIDGVGAFVERLLSACPKVTVLATSRARLVVPFEWVFPVHGLSLQDGEGAGDAVALFVERAAMAGWSPRSTEDVRRIVAICDALEGSALAIELAAARLAALGLDGLETGLANPLGLLAGGPRMDERHRSVRSALDWSYGLLDRDEQAMLRRASVFAGTFNAEAAATVAGYPPLTPADVPEALARLADHSLLVVTSGPSGTRYRMLETIRQYGTERLAELGEDVDVLGRQLEWCLATAAVLDVDQDGGAAFDAVADDLRAALGWAADQPDRRADAYRLAVRLGELTFGRGMPTEAQRRFEQAAGLASDDLDAARALHLGAAAASCRLLGNEALRLYRAAAEAARKGGHPRDAAIELTRAAELLNRCPGIMAELPPPSEVDAMLAEARSLGGGDPRVEAVMLVTEAGGDQFDTVTADLAERAVELARRVGDPRLESAALDQLTVVHLALGEVLEGAACTRRRVELLTPFSSDLDVAFEMSDALHMAPLTCLGAGDLPAARQYAQRRRELPFFREEGHLVVNWSLVRAALAGDWDEALELAERFRIGWEREGRLPLGGFAVAPAAVAMVYGLRGDDKGRAEWLAIFDDISRVIVHLTGRTSGFRPVCDALVALHHAEIDAAVDVLRDDPETLKTWHTGVWRQWYAAVWAETAVLAEHPDRTERLARARSITLRNPIATAIVDRAEALMTGDRDQLLAAAASFDAAECPYQQARALVLAGGRNRTEGEGLLTAIGAAPMAV